MKSIRKILCGTAAAVLLCLTAAACSSESPESGDPGAMPAEAPTSQPMEGK